MKRKFFYLATALVALASCTNDDFIGDEGSKTLSDGGIQFGLRIPGSTRADIYGKAAATLLNNNFYVTGTKGEEALTYPTTTLVFDNYLVHFGVNTAGTTASNTANWEYVGIQPGTGSYTNYAYLTSMGRTADDQTIKYWDYSVPQYHFMAFSTGTHNAVTTTPTTGQIGVTAMNYGSALGGEGTAYTFTLPDVNALKQAYITDIVEVNRDVEGYGKEVQLKFKSLGAKVRIALYETVPGYSVKDVTFYTVDGTTDFSGAKGATAALISADANGIPKNGQIKVYFPHVGTKYQSTPSAGAEPKTDYNKASATIVLPAVDPLNYEKAPTFGALTAQLVARENKEVVWDPAANAGAGGWVAEGSVFLGRTLPTATFAGDKNADFYEAIFPVSSPSPLTLRVDYTLVPTDGAGENIIVKGAKAVVPSTYTKWLPNYAYTYVFKISDNTNGWTGTGTQPSGLFPITFDAVVAEATEATGEQTTITTVATPTITTYQQGHTYETNEYSKAGNKLYVQVMDNSTSPATLVDDLDEQTSDATPTDRSKLYLISRAATEAEVMDALQNRTTELSAANVTGRNSITLTNAAYITNTVTSIVNGVDDNSITVAEGTAAEIAIASLTEDKSYAYVYDYSDAAKTTTDVYQPITVEPAVTDVHNVKYVANTTLASWDDGTADHYTNSENAAAGFLYFSITTNGGAPKTYSFISVDDKIGQALPDGLLKYPVGSLSTGAVNEKAAANTFYFAIYVRNTGKYAVKVIKIVA